jgi:hypothetical protein
MRTYPCAGRQTRIKSAAKVTKRQDAQTCSRCLCKILSYQLYKQYQLVQGRQLVPGFASSFTFRQEKTVGGSSVACWPGLRLRRPAMNGEDETPCFRVEMNQMGRVVCRTLLVVRRVLCIPICTFLDQKPHEEAVKRKIGDSGVAVASLYRALLKPTISFIVIQGTSIVEKALRTL